PAVQIFWIATEDHDYEEIQWASILDRDSGLRKIRIDLSNGESSPVGWLSLHEDVDTAVSECLSNLPDLQFQSDVAELLRSAYKPLISPVDAFGRMMAK